MSSAPQPTEREPDGAGERGGRGGVAFLWVAGAVVAGVALLWLGTPRIEGGPSRAQATQLLLQIVSEEVQACERTGKEPNDVVREANTRLDAWGQPIRASLEHGRLAVTSAGPDGQWGTKDDVHLEPRRPR